MVFPANYLEKKERIHRVEELMRHGDWRAVLELFQREQDYREPLLVWIIPSADAINFIYQELEKLGLRKISSVGCGCGTLEWLLQESTGLQVTGYEVNRGWWEGPHSTQHFIPLEYVDERSNKCCLIPADTALLFCYFNNITFFHSYLQEYTGSCVILIGPIDGSRHCDPEPRYLESWESGRYWRVQASMELQGGDEIVIYTRR